MLRKEVIMKPNSFFYTVRQGFKNIWRNRLFSVASIATMTACILIFGVFFSILMNVTHMIRTLEEEVGVTALFDEGLEEARMKEIGAEIKKIDHVTEVTFTSAEEAWKNFQEEYCTLTEIPNMPRALRRTILWPIPQVIRFRSTRSRIRIRS